MTRQLALIVTTLWVGGLWITGLSAYTLFQTVADKQLAGGIAGILFNNISYIGIASGFYLLIQRILDNGPSALKQSYFWVVFAMLALVLLGQFGIQPILAQLKAEALPKHVMDSALASQFGMWHGIAGALFVLECLLGLMLIFKTRY